MQTKQIHPQISCPLVSKSPLSTHYVLGTAMIQMKGQVQALEVFAILRLSRESLNCSIITGNSFIPQLSY
jgi:hypothetical protein